MIVSGAMDTGKSFAAVWSINGLEPLPIIHEAAAFAAVGKAACVQLRVAMAGSKVATVAR